MPPATRRRSIWLPSLGGLISEVVEGQNLATHFTTISLALGEVRVESIHVLKKSPAFPGSSADYGVLP